MGVADCLACDPRPKSESPPSLTELPFCTWLRIGGDSVAVAAIKIAAATAIDAVADTLCLRVAGGLG